MRIHEEIIHNRLLKHLQKSSKLILREFPFLSRVVDIVSYDKDSDEIVAIEIKLKNFKELCNQINICRYFADKVYIVLPKTKYNATVKYRRLAKDIGVITFDVKGRKVGFNVEIEPERSHVKNEKLSLKSKLLFKEYMGGRRCAKR